MKKLAKVFAVVLLVALMFTSCATTKAERVLNRERRAAVKDGEPRIVCLAPDMVEVVYALGMGDYIVGWSAYTDYPAEVQSKQGWKPYEYYSMEKGYTSSLEFDVKEELSREVAAVSMFYDCNEEIISQLDSTIILGSQSAQKYLCEDLAAKGYNAICFEYATLDEIYDMMIQVGDLLGISEYSRLLVESYYAEIEEIKAITANLKTVPVYFEIAHQADYGVWGVYGPYTEGKGSPITEIIEIAGGKNIFDDIEGSYMEVTFEDVVEKNPEVILSPYWPNAGDFEVTTIAEIMGRKDFDTTDAVKHGRVYYYDSSLFKRFGARTVTAIKKLAYLLHPYYFDQPENSVSPWELGKIDIFEDFPEPLN